MQSKPETVLVCVNKRPKGNSPCCGLRGNIENLQLLKNEAEKQGLPITVEEIVCLGHCNQGPTARIAPGGNFFFNVGPDSIQDILDDVKRNLEKFGG